MSTEKTFDVKAAEDHILVAKFESLTFFLHGRWLSETTRELAVKLKHEVRQEILDRMRSKT